MITRRAGGPGGATTAGTASTGAAAVSATGTAEVAETADSGSTAAAGTTDATGAVGAVAAGSTCAATGATGLTTGGGGATTAGAAVAGAAGTATGRSATGGVAGGATTTGGRAITGPTGGLLAIAGICGFMTIFAPWRGRGTIRRGAGGCPGTWGAGGADEVLGGGAATTRGGRELTVAAVGGGATTAGRCGGGTAFTADSACLRSRIALRASPGLDTFERSNFGLLSTVCRPAPLLRPPFLKYSRTLSAWSASIELEWVFPVTPIASSASRIGLLFTSSSRARSLIRTLLIRPFSLPCALSCSYQPHRGRNLYCMYYP
jgi:hypothetical protein